MDNGQLRQRNGNLKMKRKKFKYLEAIVFDPEWSVESYPEHPLKREEVVYYLGDIPNVDGHCIVLKWSGAAVSMVHPGDFRKANAREL